MSCAARSIVACLPWPIFKPTELEADMWRLARRLQELNKEMSAIEARTGIQFDPELDNYKNILDTVAVENDLCRGVDDIDHELRSFSLDLIRGHYLLKEIERLKKGLEELHAIKQSGGKYEGRGSHIPPQKLH